MYQLKNIARLMTMMRIRKKQLRSQKKTLQLWSRTLMRITRKRKRRPRQQMMFQLKKTMMRMGRIKTKWVIRNLPFLPRIKRMMIWRQSRKKQPSPQLQLNERTHHHRIETLAGERIMVTRSSMRMHDACKAARKALGLIGFLPVGSKSAAGKALYAKAKAIRAT